MRIITKRQLMNLPSGVIFSYYDSHNYNVVDLMLKGDTININNKNVGFYETQLLNEIEGEENEDFFSLHERINRDKIFSLDYDVEGREDCYHDEGDSPVWIYEIGDLLKLIDKLSKSINATDNIRRILS